VAERLKAPHSKCGIGASLSGVRIPPSPPYNRIVGAADDEGILRPSPSERQRAGLSVELRGTSLL
jgi:hypothetical protein